MRLYSTNRGIGREDQPGLLSLVDVPYAELGALIEDQGLDALAGAHVRETVALDQVVLRPPIRRPGKILIVGLNYPSHGDEAVEMLAALGREEVEFPTEPNCYIAAGSAVAAHRQPIMMPTLAAEQIDYEGELAVVIGRDATRVTRDEAWAHVAGLTIVNDVSARDVQMRAMTGDPTVSIGGAKSFDTFKPLGPCLVTTEEFSRPLDLRLQTRVNGELRQDDRTGTVLHQVEDVVSRLSHFHTLQAGDVICTGTPRGAGFFTGRFLKPGDSVDITVEGIGTLSNTVAS